jgi:uncharacterized metal-binding protein YceD (DUF177 family)
VKEHRIYLDRLKDGNVEHIKCELSSDFMAISESELEFSGPVSIDMEAYVTEENLILHFDASTDAMMPCSICNAMFKMHLAVKRCYHVVDCSTLASSIFDYSELLREALLIELPSVAECHNGNCPDRSFVSKYLKKEDEGGEDEEIFPFKDLNFTTN